MEEGPVVNNVNGVTYLCACGCMGVAPHKTTLKCWQCGKTPLKIHVGLDLGPAAYRSDYASSFHPQEYASGLRVDDN